MTLTLQMPQPKRFRLSFRIPAWAPNATVDNAKGSAGQWKTLEREWKSGDRVEVQIPLNMRMQPVDRWHPNRVAIVRGPLTIVQDANYHDPVMRLPMHDEDLPKWILPGDTPTDFRLQTSSGQMSRLKLHPFYSIGPDFPYSTYFDRDKMPYALW